MMIDQTTGVTTPQGFLAAGVTAGLKKSGKPDLALVVSQGPQYTAAGVFTSNRFPAAPVQWSRQVLVDGQLRAVVLNSGSANACTGSQGQADAQSMAEQVAALIGVEPSEVGVCSTGMIGLMVPMDKMSAGITQVAALLSTEGGEAAAKAIMTTDTVHKQASYTSAAGWRIGGMAKGAGMLAPALATMLVVITTDVQLTAAQADHALRGSCAKSFDRADSDGCMSTNDSVILLANGASEIPADQEFYTALDVVCISLARQLIADAEGAEHAITITVHSAASEDDALEVARAIGRSNL
ncbi:MAG: bifunctional ornithine acetyltransferase/N-acetylglutamate synthase, partial [Propionibacteriaceae bacterium]|nr:bifunctional ornithine acetyltransferase/N-acetylglutamate synthase [Propionibacteriaceae bacterium]